MILNTYFLIQNLGTSTIKKVKNSNLPIIIAIDNVYLSVGGNWVNPSEGPIILPRPGPTTANEVIAADIEVKKS